MKALDLHAPVRTRKINERVSAPWFNKQITEAKQRRRRAERQWKKSHLVIHREIYKTCIEEVKDIIIAERKHFNDKIQVVEHLKHFLPSSMK